MAARDAARTVAQALDSLQAQSFTNWEAIIIDDGSVDDTPAILAGYQARDARIRVVRGVGEGASSARNRGVAQARGQWLSFLDADDWVTPDFLEQSLAAIHRQPAAQAAYCAVQRVMPDGRMLKRRADRRLEGDAFAIFARTCSPVVIHGIMIDTALVRAAGGFDAALMTCEDWDLWQRLSRAGLQWVMADGPTAFYRVSEGSLSRKTERLAKDAATVIGRGFGEDERVPHALPRHAAGAVAHRGDDLATTLAWFTLWNHGVDRGSGGNIPIDVHLLEPLDPDPAMAQAILETLIEGFCIGARLVPGQLAAHWDRIGPAFAAIMTALEQAWKDPLPVRRLQYRFDHILLDADDSPAPRVLSRTISLCVPALAPRDMPLPPGIDMVRAQLVEKDGTGAALRFGALGGVSAQEWTGRIVAATPVSRLIRAGLSGHGKALLAAGWRAGLQALRHPRRMARPQERARLLNAAVEEGLRPDASTMPMADTHGARLAELRARAQAQAARLPGLSVGKQQPPSCAAAVADRRGEADRGGEAEGRPFPVLFYPEVSDEATNAHGQPNISPALFARQMGWLRDRGYQAIGTRELGELREIGTPWTGRPVLIAFAGAMGRTFAQQALPILRDHGLFAEVFVQTGMAASMDGRNCGNDCSCLAHLGAQTLATLAEQGMRIGSALVSGRVVDGLSTEDMAWELALSAALLERWTGLRPTGYAAPRAIADDRLAPLASELGYRVGVGGQAGMVQPGGHRIDLPRIEVSGAWNLTDFIVEMEALRDG